MIGTQDTRPVVINEWFEADEPVSPAEYDRLLADGWRHFGAVFTRYSLSVYRDEIQQVQPLRIRLTESKLSKSQRRIISKNKDLEINIGPIRLNKEVFELFDRHKSRFEAHVPESIYTFLSLQAGMPTDLYQVTARLDGRLLAISFFDFGVTSVSAIYACFEPGEKSRSLGIFTMLKVIEWTAATGRDFYYPGYAYRRPSFYDYKKRFSGLEEFDWQGDWSGEHPFVG